MEIEGDIILRDIEQEDCSTLEAVFHHATNSTYTSYYKKVLSGDSELIVAIYKEELVGYAKLDWKSDYEDLEEENIPEIKELYVVEGFRKQGIATKLMNELEQRASLKSKYCAIGVGLSEAYESAQHLFAKRGYEPDGKGIFYIEPEFIYDELEVDDNQALMMIKKIG